MFFPETLSSFHALRKQVKIIPVDCFNGDKPLNESFNLSPVIVFDVSFQSILSDLLTNLWIVLADALPLVVLLKAVHLKEFFPAGKVTTIMLGQLPLLVKLFSTSAVIFFIPKPQNPKRLNIYVLNIQINIRCKYIPPFLPSARL